MQRNGLHNVLRDLRKLNLSLETHIERLEKALNEDPERGKSRKAEIRFTDAELREEWHRLQSDNRDNSQVEQRLHEFVTNKSKAELAAFIRINELPIATKDSRRKIAIQLRQLLRVGATIRGG